ncbi:hypothetical protein FRC08_000298 [Ceratobasidium sp. 394]|nr:hypothetical protein FRC08_000298 [Ceratobasidium sp. 394]KAG9077518.1 hypothetical protein FS749_010593 [Ceratobasidium sp. UAMH 11750]
MSSQLQRGRACHECRRRKLKCTAERPTCDNCRRAQSSSRGSAKKCTYDRAPEDEQWEHWSGNGSRDRLLKQTPNAPPRASPARSLGSAEVRETPSPRPAWAPASEDSGMAPSLPITSNPLITSLWGGPVTPNMNDSYSTSTRQYSIDTPYIGNLTSHYFSIPDDRSQPAAIPTCSDFISLGTVDQMMVHPDHNQFIRDPYERLPQQTHPMGLVYTEYDIAPPQTSTRPMQANPAGMPPNHEPRFI